MIVIDMDMPTKCMNCQLLGGDRMYCQVYPRKDLVANSKPDWCPIKCDIEDIKAEISNYKDDKIIHTERNEMIDIMLEIIDKHIGGDNK